MERNDRLTEGLATEAEAPGALTYLLMACVVGIVILLGVVAYQAVGW